MKNQENIRENRQKIRSGLKKLICIDKPKLLQKRQNTPSQEKQKKHQKMRRKTSADIRQLGNCWDMAQLNEMVVQSFFEEFYDLKEKIDEGAHSVVYLCQQKQTKIQYVAKMIRMRDFDIIYNLKQQYRILKNLDHPNIIKVHNLYINQKLGVSHIVLDYIQAPNLRIHMLKNRTLTQMQAAQILSCILQALKYIHSMGICHRDIKPENILYDYQKGQLKIIDFQISKMVKYKHQKLQMWSNTGTQAYKAPQMFGGHIYSQVVDIWAVGIIAYQMLIGNLPFRHLYSSELVRQIKEQQPNYEKPNLTKSCIQFIQKCLEKNPLKRFTANQALHSPFLLKYSSLSSSAQSPKFKKNGSQGYKRQSFQIECIKCLDQDASPINRQAYEADTGIRIIINQSNR